MNAYQGDHDADDPPPETVRAHHYTRQDAAGRTILVLYDRENPLAWIQSTASLRLTDWA